MDFTTDAEAHYSEETFSRLRITGTEVAAKEFEKCVIQEGF